jgi:hypothetical protein
MTNNQDSIKPSDEKTTSKVGGFKIPVPRPPVDPTKLEQFAKGAGESQVAERSVQPPVVPTPLVFAKPEVSGAERTRQFNIRMLPEQYERLDHVFRHSTFKSKQTMGESLFLQAIEDLAKKLGV